MVLDDVLERGLRVVFCGTAVGNRSAARRAYYAGPGNKFWAILHRVGLTPPLEPEDFMRLPEYGIGLTDLAKNRSGVDNQIHQEDYDVAGFRRNIEKYRPQVVAFNGKKAAEVFLGRSVQYGLQMETIGMTMIFVLPSSSGAAAAYWDESEWKNLTKFLTGRKN